MPQDTGFEIVEARLSISLETPKSIDSVRDLENISKELPSKVKDVILPSDILGKAREMSEVYLYTFCAENSIRAFIENIANKNSDKFKLSAEMQRKITNRKESVAKNKWLSTRGTSDIFYLDIEDLANVVKNNWDLFKDYFESVEWISTNIKEIADCRNPVAHHCYLQENEREIIRLNFIKILKQISDNLK